MSNLNDVLNGLSSASLWQERVYKDLHAHPEACEAFSCFGKRIGPEALNDVGGERD